MTDRINKTKKSRESNKTTKNKKTNNIIRAIQSNDYQMFQAELSDVNTVSVKGNTPLMLAIDRKLDPRFLDDLIMAKANIEAIDKQGRTALMLAAMLSPEFSSDAIVQRLIDARANVNAIITKSEIVKPRVIGTSVLINTVTNTYDTSQDSTVQLLLDNGADINFNTSYGAALHFAVFNPQAQRSTVELLLNNRADINLPALRTFGTPVMMAVLAAPDDIIWLLINHHANIYLKDVFDNNLLMLLSSSTGHIGLINYVLRLGISINETNKNNETALSMAVKYSDATTVRLLLQHGANPYHVDASGDSVISGILANTSRSLETVIPIYKVLREVGVHDTELLTKAVVGYGKSLSITEEIIKFLVADNLFTPAALHATITNPPAARLIPLLLPTDPAQKQAVIEDTLKFIAEGLVQGMVVNIDDSLPLLLLYYDEKLKIFQNLLTVSAKMAWSLPIENHMLKILTKWLTEKLALCDKTVDECILARATREYNLLPGSAIMEDLMEEIVSNQLPYEEFERALITNIRQKLPQIYEAYMLR